MPDGILPPDQFLVAHEYEAAALKELQDEIETHLREEKATLTIGQYYFSRTIKDWRNDYKHLLQEIAQRQEELRTESYDPTAGLVFLKKSNDELLVLEDKLRTNEHPRLSGFVTWAGGSNIGFRNSIQNNHAILSDHALSIAQETEYKIIEEILRGLREIGEKIRSRPGSDPQVWNEYREHLQFGAWPENLEDYYGKLFAYDRLAVRKLSSDDDGLDDDSEPRKTQIELYLANHRLLNYARGMRDDLNNLYAATRDKPENEIRHQPDEVIDVEPIDIPVNPVEAAREAELATWKRLEANVSAAIDRIRQDDHFRAQQYADDLIRDVLPVIQANIDGAADRNREYSIAERIDANRQLQGSFVEYQKLIAAGLLQINGLFDGDPGNAELAKEAEVLGALHDENWILGSDVKNAGQQLKQIRRKLMRAQFRQDMKEAVNPRNWGSAIATRARYARQKITRENFKAAGKELCSFETLLGAGVGWAAKKGTIYSLTTLLGFSSAGAAIPVALIGGAFAGALSKQVRFMKREKTWTRFVGWRELGKGAASGAFGGTIGLGAHYLYDWAAPHVSNLIQYSDGHFRFGAGPALQSPAPAHAPSPPPAPAPTTGLGPTPTPGPGPASPSPSEITPDPQPATPAPAPIPEAPSPADRGFRNNILNRINIGLFDHLRGHVKERLLSALGTEGHENWRLVAARIADAGYDNFNGLNGAGRTDFARLVGAEQFGLAKQVADQQDLHNHASESIRRSVKWLSKLPRYKAAVAPNA